MFPGSRVTILIAPLSLILLLVLRRQRRPRLRTIPASAERILVVGATSGIGKEIARQYSQRGARVMLLGRRAVELGEAVKECEALSSTGRALGMVADGTSPADMIRARDRVLAEWGGLDTLIIAAGVSALRPLLAVAGVEHDRARKTFEPPQVTLEGLERAKEVASGAIAGNYLGPLVALVAFIPLLSQTSTQPAILMISSLASIIPPPTRTLYGSSKAASLLLFQALSIEHAQIKFTAVIPSTVEGNFRSSAVDSGDVRESLEKALSKSDVAAACIKGVDQEARTVWLPAAYRLSVFAYQLVPSLIEGIARRNTTLREMMYHE